MYRAKQQGGHGYAVFDTNMEVEISSIQERERELRDLVARRAFAWWYQPIYRLATGRLEGFECLLRKPNAAGAMESFRELLPVAEDTGLSITIGRDTVESACSQLAAWDTTLPGNALILTINLSRRQFFHDDLVPQLRKAIAGARIDPARLLLEIAEDTLNENQDRAVAILQRLADCGVRVAMDNFGATLAPLNLLIRLPIDMVKLDIRLTASATGTGRQLAVLQSLVNVCSACGVQLLAQGIETSGHLRALQDLGCPLGQGFFLAPPLDAAQAFYLASQNSAANPPAGM
jgi:EAL domain-containing protein (putative c-di-GMP-specific phosphodiesterase class I)